MKTRIGFVSNSSSSSFLIYGIEIEEGIDLEEKYEQLYKKLKGDVECFLPDGWGTLFVGVSWSKVGDDETGKQFKERAIKLIKEIAPELIEEDTEFKTLEAVYPN